MKSKISLILLTLILLLSAYLRLYHISDYMTFLGDEGRDVLVAKEILEGNFTLLGPRSSAGDFFMGPIYYYMITPFLFLFNYDPVGPAVMVAILSVFTTWLIFFVGKKWFGETAGLIAAALYSVSPVVITYSHSSWNPDVLPFFALLFIHIIYVAVHAKNAWKFFIFAGFLLGISLQLHYLAVLLGVVAAVYVLWANWYKDKAIKIGLTVKNYLQILSGFIIGFSPFLVFEARHEFANTRSIFSFIFSDTLQKSYTAQSSYLDIVSDAFFRIFARLVFFFPSLDMSTYFDKLFLQVFSFVSVVIILFALYFLFRTKNKYVLVLTGLWLFLSLALLGLYKKSIYDYLFTFIFPLPFLIIGNFLSRLLFFGKDKKQKIIFSILSIILFVSIFAYNLNGMPFRNEPNRQKEQVKTISKAIIEHSDNKPYNFALITKGNSDHAYRYFLEILGHPPVGLENTLIDPERKSVTKQLLIVCEDPNCEPLGNPGFEVAGFGRAEIAGVWNVSVVKVFRLVPYKQ